MAIQCWLSCAFTRKDSDLGIDVRNSVPRFLRINSWKNDPSSLGNALFKTILAYFRFPLRISILVFSVPKHLPISLRIRSPCPSNKERIKFKIEFDKQMFPSTGVSLSSIINCSAHLATCRMSFLSNTLCQKCGIGAVPP